jgi:hypothetical protein
LRTSKLRRATSDKANEVQGVAGKSNPDPSELPAGLRQRLEELLSRVNNDVAKRELWGNRFSDADRGRFTGQPRELLKQYSIIEIWHIARGTPTWNECIVEVAHALGFIDATQRESLRDQLGAKPAPGSGRGARQAAVPHWDDEARELRYRGKVVRVVKRPNQAYNIVTILRAFQAAGWPPRIADPHGRKPSDETRRRDVSNLNTGLDTTVMKFACDGDGTGFLWRRVAPAKPAKAKKAAKRRPR